MELEAVVAACGLMWYDESQFEPCDAAQSGALVDSVLGQGLALGACLREFVSRQGERGGTLRNELPEVQRDILDCLRRGQSDKQIAHGLCLSTHAVDYHMRPLRRRFSAQNRLPLMSAAFAGGQAPLSARATG